MEEFGVGVSFLDSLELAPQFPRCRTFPDEEGEPFPAQAPEAELTGTFRNSSKISSN